MSNNKNREHTLVNPSPETGGGRPGTSLHFLALGRHKRVCRKNLFGAWLPSPYHLQRFKPAETLPGKRSCRHRADDLELLHEEEVDRPSSPFQLARVLLLNFEHRNVSGDV